MSLNCLTSHGFNLAPYIYSYKASADASRLGLNTHIVRDAGRTQIAAGSKTVLCVGPGEGNMHADYMVKSCLLFSLYRR